MQHECSNSSTFVERVKVELLFRLRAPQANVDAVRRCKSGNRQVVGNGEHLLAAMPTLAVLTLRDVSVEANAVDDVESRDFPRIVHGEPVVGDFLLIAVLAY